MILVPGHKPLLTTLTTQQLFELFPKLNLYIESSNPGLAVLPASVPGLDVSGIVSYTGVAQALRHREAQLSNSETGSSLAGLIEEYSALRYLGQKATSRIAWSLGKIIHSAIANEMCLEEYQEIWALRVMPSTESFINAMVNKLAKFLSDLWQLLRMPVVRQAIEEDADFKCTIERALEIRHWTTEAEGGLMMKIVRKGGELMMQEKRMKRIGKLGKRARLRAQRSVVDTFKPTLKTIAE
jgi:hypothetical protein